MIIGRWYDVCCQMGLVYVPLAFMLIFILFYCLCLFPLKYFKSLECLQTHKDTLTLSRAHTHTLQVHALLVMGW